MEAKAAAAPAMRGATPAESLEPGPAFAAEGARQPPAPGPRRRRAATREPFSAVAPTSTGSATRHDSSLASGRRKRRARAAASVIPLREVPGHERRRLRDAEPQPVDPAGVLAPALLRRAVGERERERAGRQAAGQPARAAHALLDRALEQAADQRRRRERAGPAARAAAAWAASAARRADPAATPAAAPACSATSSSLRARRRARRRQRSSSGTAAT